MLASASVSCDPGATFTQVCQWIADRDPSGVLGPMVQRLLAGLLVLGAIFIAGTFLRRGLERAPGIGRDPQVKTLVHNVMRALTWTFALLAALVAAGLNISVLLTFGGLASLALGLAFQDVMRNLLAGIFLLVEQPFKLGDVITVGDATGTVETIQLRTTALKTFDGRLAILPNLACFNAPVVNSSAYATRRFTVSVRIPRDRSLTDALEAAQKVLTSHRGLVKTPAAVAQAEVDTSETNLIHCRFWLDYRMHDPDEVSAAIAADLSALGVTSP